LMEALKFSTEHRSGVNVGMIVGSLVGLGCAMALF